MTGSGTLSMERYVITTKSPAIRMWQRAAGALIVALAAIGAGQAFAGNTQAARSDRLLVGESLTAARELVSRDGSHRLAMRANGSAAVLSSSGMLQWQSTAANAGASLQFRADGKLVLLTATGAGRWWSPPAGATAELFVLDSGQLAAYIDQRPIWWTPIRATVAGQTVSTGTGPDYPVLPRNPALHPFASTSPWNTPIGSGARFEGDNGALAKRLRDHTKAVVNHTAWSVAVYQASASDPYAAVRSIRNSQTRYGHVPTRTVPTAGDDRHVAVLQPDNRSYLDSFKWENWTGSRWNTQLTSVLDLHGAGINEGHRAARTPAIAGLIRKHELESGHIPHALALAVPDSVLKSGFVWPARAQDANHATAYAGNVPMGTLFAIPPGVDLNQLGLSLEGLVLGEALQNYGAYVVDRAGTAALYCELACDSTRVAALQAAWLKLRNHVRAVTNNSSTNVGGGGTPGAPLAPPLP